MADIARGYLTGDGITSDLISVNFQVTDANLNVAIVGIVQPAGQPSVAITGSPVTAPAIPGSGQTFWILQVNKTTGAASIKSDPTTMPTADAGCELIFSDTLIPADTNLVTDPSSIPASDPTDVMPTT